MPRIQKLAKFSLKCLSFAQTLPRPFLPYPFTAASLFLNFPSFHLRISIFTANHPLSSTLRLYPLAEVHFPCVLPVFLILQLFLLPDGTFELTPSVRPPFLRLAVPFRTRIKLLRLSFRPGLLPFDAPERN